MTGWEEFDSLKAERYDQRVKETLPFYNLIHSEVLSVVRAAAKNCTLWLDTGCGTGNLVERAVLQFPDTTFFLVDPSEAMLKRAREKLTSRSNLCFLDTAPTNELQGLDANSLGIITAILSHHYMDREDRISAVNKCYGLLAQSGLFVTVSHVQSQTQNGQQVAYERWRNWLLENGNNRGEAERLLERHKRVACADTFETHLGELRSVGFRTVEVFWRTYNQVGLYAIK